MSIIRYPFANLTARNYPTILDIENKWIFGDVQLIVNVSEWPYPPNIETALLEKGIAYYHFPLSEDLPDMGIDNIIEAVKVLIEADAKGLNTVIHCVGGKNRSRTVSECFAYVKTGVQFEDEYNGFPNHLYYNCAEGHLPPIEDVTVLLDNLVSGL